MKKKLCFTTLILSMCFMPLNIHAEARASGNGWHTASITKNGKPYTFTNSMARSGNSLYDACQTDAYIMRQHNAVTAYFNTYNYGYVYGYGSDKTVTCSGTSHSNYASCPYGSSQVQSIISGNGRIIMYADSTTPSDISVNY